MCTDANRASEERCTFSSHVTPSESGIVSFLNCDFLSCVVSGNGGAISFSQKETGKLGISHCTFDHCSATAPDDNGYGGGAIYSNCVYSTSISNSAFISCSCYKPNGKVGGDGGGITINGSISYPFVTQCSFFFCHADDDGGALAIWYSSGNSPQFLCDGCIFITNSATPSTDAGGGSLLLFANAGNHACTDSLFSNSTGIDGGAFYLHCSSYPQNALPVRFCFFNNNTSSHGNDVFIPWITLNNNNPLFQHCFSTSPQNRIGYFVSRYGSFDLNWLPKVRLIIRNVRF